MPDPLSLPPLPDPAARQPADPSKPAAGGWTPTPAQRAISVAAASALGALAVSLPAAVPGKWGVALSAVCAALALGLGTLLGLSSAGPRTLG